VNQEGEEPDKWASIKPRQRQFCAVACSVKRQNLKITAFILHRNGDGSRKSLSWSLARLKRLRVLLEPFRQLILSDFARCKTPEGGHTVLFGGRHEKAIQS
jgi:hypothetical protein